MTIVAHSSDAQPALRPSAVREIRIALLGLGQVGGAVAALVAETQDPLAGRFRLTSALVRDLHKPRPFDTTGVPLTTDPQAAVASRPDVVVEVLGGIEPARTLVTMALEAGIPVVTANKTLLAHCGAELAAHAAAAGTPLLFEASVIAGVPFLGTFRRRPLVRAVTALRGIVNGTSNFVLSRMAHDGVSFDEALASAQHAGFAEPDPSKDIGGDDAVEKLCVLLRHFGGFDVSPSAVDKAGITDVDPRDQQHAAAFGGALRPVVLANWHDTPLTLYAGPAYVHGTHPLCRVDGVQNAIALTTRWSGELFLSGPGAGPVVTAATVLDDVVEATAWRVGDAGGERWQPAGPVARHDAGAWFVRLNSPTLNEGDAPGLLSALGVRIRRVSLVDSRHGSHSQWLLTEPCARMHLDAALDVLSAKTGARPRSIPAVE